MSSPFDARTLRDAFGAFLTGVTVVTSTDAEGNPFGLTANSFSSVSLDPPLLLVCIGKRAGSYAPLSEATGFAVNILAEDQTHISNTFARPADDRFAGIAWHPGHTGAPLLAGAAAWFDCAVHQRVDAGDHMILIGEVKALDNSGKTGLGYARGAYFTPSHTANRLLENSAQTLHLIAKRDGQIILMAAPDGGFTLPVLSKTKSERIEHLQPRFAAQLGVPVQMGMLYSIYDDTQRGSQHLVYRASLGPGSAHNGHLFAIDALPLAQIKDPAIRETLKRYQQETRLGNFGVYFGNQTQGQVHTLNPSSQYQAGAQ